jgi:RNA polymerase sigma-70 factor, ECF subfamily
MKPLAHSGNDPLTLAVYRKHENAMENLVRAFEGRLFSYAVHLIRNPFDAQEVTQDAFMKAYRALTERYSEEQCRSLALGPWLFRITRNLAFNRLRMRRSLEKSIVTDAHKEAEKGWSISSYKAKSELPGNLAVLEAALKCLKPREQELIQLRFIEELSYAEIAKVLQKTEASLRGKVFRAVRQLHAALARLGGHRGL